MNSVSHEGFLLEKQCLDHLRHLLRSVPWLEFREDGSKATAQPSDNAYDFSIQVASPKGGFTELWVECKKEVRPSTFLMLKRRMPPYSDGIWVLAAPRISPSVAKLCAESGWGWFDLAGNVRLDIPGVFYLERTGNDSLPLPASNDVANLGSKEAARVIRALLHPDHLSGSWTQRYLHTHCQPGVSLGLINKVVRHLQAEALLEKAKDGRYKVIDPQALLFAWRDAYRPDLHQRLRFFTLLQRKQLSDALNLLGIHAGGRAAYASFSAADFLAPHVMRQPKTWLYVAADMVPRLPELIEARETDSGANLEVWIPADEGVFYLSEKVGENRLPATSLVQTYVDLWHAGGRGQEAAEALLEQKLKPFWAALPAHDEHS